MVDESRKRWGRVDRHFFYPNQDKGGDVALRKKELWALYLSNSDIRAKKSLIELYLPLVSYLCSRFSQKLPSHVDKRDLSIAGVIGLIDAVEKYDPDSGVRFETYASVRVRGAMIDELRSMDWVPRSVRRKASMVNTAYRSLESQLKRPPSDQEMADYLEMSLSKFYSIVSETEGLVMFSLDVSVSFDQGGKGGALIDNLEDMSQSTKPAYQIQLEHLKEILMNCIEELSPQERNVLALYYYEELMLKEIGRIVGVSESRVSQIRSQAEEKIKKKLRENMS